MTENAVVRARIDQATKTEAAAVVATMGLSLSDAFRLLLNRCRRLAKDWECRGRNDLAFLRWASVRMMVRNLCQITV